MREENTEDTVASSPPAFMMQPRTDDTPDPDDAEKAKAKAERAAAREAAAQDKDAFDIRLAAMQKSTTRTLELADYVAKIDGVVEKTIPLFVGVHPLGEVLDNVIGFEDAVTKLEDTLKLLKGRVSFVREVALPTRLDDEGTPTVTSEAGHRMSRTARVLASIKSGCTEAAFEWLRNNGLGSLIKETVNSSSLNAAAKELMANGHELPEETFNTHTKDGVSITRKKAK